MPNTKRSKAAKNKTTPKEYPTMNGKRFVYYILETQRDKNGYIPSAVLEGESGHYPMSGGEGKTPWYWGKDIETARKVCAKANEEMGYTKEEVAKIVAASMR